jgi:hypothetical protein
LLAMQTLSLNVGVIGQHLTHSALVTPHTLLLSHHAMPSGFFFIPAALFALVLSGSLFVTTLPAQTACVVRAVEALPAADTALLDEIERASFRFFAEQSHPRTKLVRDRARADGSPSQGEASVASSGFALNAWVVAVERGWVICLHVHLNSVPGLPSRPAQSSVI